MIRHSTVKEILLAVLWLLSTDSSGVLSWASTFEDDRPPLQATQPYRLPNFVVILTDDLDWTLGGANASTLHRTRALIAEQGTTFNNWFVQTPVCCPSRAELLTGKYFHNLKVPTIDSKNGCMHINVAPHANHSFYQRDYFAQYFTRWNYTVGIFGKHLNNANPADFIPNGVDEMLINGGGDYLDPTFTVATRQARKPHDVTFNNCTESTGMPCYSTSIIGNASLAWIQRHLERTRSSSPNHPQPFFALISVKAPHILDGPDFPMAVPAPWYAATTIPEESAPRLPNYNYSATDHHWLVRSQAPMTLEEGQKVNDLYLSRLKTLISVDDLVEALISDSDLPLDNTYIFFTSDNGYRLGQFRMPMCKLHAYENDIRVPMMIRGPYMAKNATSHLLSTHVNLMPTLLGLVALHDQNHKTKNTNHTTKGTTTTTPNVVAADATSAAVVPETMDGSNLAACIIDHDGNAPTTTGPTFPSTSPCTVPSALLIEYTSLGPVVRYNHTVDFYNHSFVALRILWNHNLWEPGAFGTGYQNQDDNEYHNHTTTGSSRMAFGRNIKYVEYRDCRWDWNGTLQPPLEQELFDLDQDPYELTNIVAEVSPIVIQALQYQLQRYLQCQGESCRIEQQQQRYNLEYKRISATRPRSNR